MAQLLFPKEWGILKKHFCSELMLWMIPVESKALKRDNCTWKIHVYVEQIVVIFLGIVGAEHVCRQRPFFVECCVIGPVRSASRIFLLPAIFVLLPSRTGDELGTTGGTFLLITWVSFCWQMTWKKLKWRIILETFFQNCLQAVISWNSRLYHSSGKGGQAVVQPVDKLIQLQLVAQAAVAAQTCRLTVQGVMAVLNWFCSLCCQQPWPFTEHKLSS